MNLKKLNVNEEGMQRFFGSLESKIMETLWKYEKRTIKQTHDILNGTSAISLNAVMTVMMRLSDKGVLRKETTGGGRNRVTFFYPTQTREQFITEQTRVVTVGLIEDFGPLVVNHFIDQLGNIDPDLIDKLEIRLNELKKK